MATFFRLFPSSGCFTKYTLAVPVGIRFFITNLLQVRTRSILLPFYFLFSVLKLFNILRLFEESIKTPAQCLHVHFPNLFDITIAIFSCLLLCSHIPLYIIENFPLQCSIQWNRFRSNVQEMGSVRLSRINLALLVHHTTMIRKLSVNYNMCILHVGKVCIWYLLIFSRLRRVVLTH